MSKFNLTEQENIILKLEMVRLKALTSNLRDLLLQTDEEPPSDSNLNQNQTNNDSSLKLENLGQK